MQAGPIVAKQHVCRSLAYRKIDTGDGYRLLSSIIHDIGLTLMRCV